MGRQLELNLVEKARQARAEAFMLRASETLQTFVYSRTFNKCRSEVVVRELERDLVDKARRARAETFMSRALECFDSGVVFVDTAQPEWKALHCSSAFTKVDCGLTAT